MKALLRSARIAPKKANLIARMVRGMPVPDAMEALRRTHKKAARMVELLLRSAIANASHNEKQDPQTMVIKSIVVNQGEAYRRGMPKARGQTRPYRKFLSHISMELGFPDTEKGMRKLGSRKVGKEEGEENDDSAKKSAKSPSQTAQKKVKKESTRKVKTSSKESSEASA